MPDRERRSFPGVDGAPVQLWACLNPAHEGVEWDGGIARCAGCGLTSEMTDEFVYGVAAAAYAQAAARLRRCASHPAGEALRPPSPLLEFMARHGLEAGSSICPVLHAAAAEVEGLGEKNG